MWLFFCFPQYFMQEIRVNISYAIYFFVILYCMFYTIIINPGV